MVKTLRHDFYFHDQFSARDYNEQRLREVEQERCGLCWDLWPKSMMRDNDGVRRCPDCYEERDIYRINEIQQYDNDRRATRQMRPQMSLAPLQNYTPPYIGSMTTAAGVRVLGSAPLRLSRGGAAVTLLVNGGDFVSTDAFSYSTGISDSSAPALTGSTLWTLSLAAASNMTPGEWHLTYNDHTYRNILSVR